MKTKAQIVQELLDKKAITAEDAVILLHQDVVYVPQWQPTFQPLWPNYPTSPNPPFPNDFPTICKTEQHG